MTILQGKYYDGSVRLDSGHSCEERVRGGLARGGEGSPGYEMDWGTTRVGGGEGGEEEGGGRGRGRRAKGRGRRGARRG